MQWIDFESFLFGESEHIFVYMKDNCIMQDWEHVIFALVFVWKINTGRRLWILGRDTADCAWYCLLSCLPLSYSISQNTDCTGWSVKSHISRLPWSSSPGSGSYYANELHLSDFFGERRQPKQLSLNNESSWIPCSVIYHQPP